MSVSCETNRIAAYIDGELDHHETQLFEGLTRLMVIGEGITKQRAGEIVHETTGADLRPLDADELGLQLPSRDFNFDSIAAPAGLATMSW